LFDKKHYSGGRIMKRFSVAIGLSLCLFLALPFPALAYDPNLDSDGNGWIDQTDLLYFIQHWHTGQEGLETATPTPTEGAETPTPTDTPEEGQAPVLSLPELFPVEMSEVTPDSDFYLGEATFPVTLSNVEGLVRAEILFPFPVDSGSDYQVALSSAALPTLVEGWTLTDTQIMDGFDLIATGWVLEQPEGTPLAGTGNPEDILMVTVSVSLSGALVQDTVVPLVFHTTSLQGTGGQAIAHTTVSGSLLIAPSGEPVATSTPTETQDGGATATPTPTEGGVTHTPTPTSTYSGSAVALQLSACRLQEYAGNQISVVVDQLDSGNHIANPGVEGGDAERTIQLTLTGSGQFVSGGGKTTSGTLDDPEGLDVVLTGTAPGTVTVNASASGLADAAPLEIEFLNGGRIGGLIQAPDPVGGGLKPATMQDVLVRVYIPGTTETVAIAYPSFQGDGQYLTKFIGAGTYDVSVEPSPLFIGLPGAAPLGAICLSGIVVVAGQTTENVDANLEERSGGARVFGTVTAGEGGPIVGGFVTLAPSNGLACGAPSYTASLAEDQGAFGYELPNIPGGKYSLSVTAYGSDQQSLFGNRTPVSVNVPGSGEIQKDVEVFPIFTLKLNLVAPVNYERAAAQPTFQWTLVGASGTPLGYVVSVTDRCGELLWKSVSLSGTSAKYGGPALRRNTIYDWTVFGISLDGGTTAIPDFSQDIIGMFIVE